LSTFASSWEKKGGGHRVVSTELAVNDWRQGLSNRRFHQACSSQLAGKDEYVHIWRYDKEHWIVTKTNERQAIVKDDQVEKELLEWDAAMATKVSEGVRNDADHEDDWKEQCEDTSSTFL
jgi:hypothetical protein